ncbi:FecR family protein [Mariniphaga anaerophila]|uniref:FecR family protein n=1 Tax=Mariniphaga anaerophila TaxID=1484053 RepID=A0A1M4TMN6_9BACT|nr:FecR family protein [Mariniphaga anaerophila]SHE45749.1 FecR family protein [Mariniphaga anaerophila]
MNKRNDSNEKNISGDFLREVELEKRILRVSGGLTTPQGKPEEEVLEAILKGKAQQKSRQMYPTVRILRAAAAIAVLLVAAYSGFVIFSREKATAGFAEHTALTLPDGTAVTLNASSEIVWSKRPFSSRRTLKLDGEAFLDVKKGEKFIIKTKNGKVEILGTQLNVLSRDNRFEVSCMRGKVRVLAGSSSQIIVPGETVKLTPNGLEKEQVENIGLKSLWQQGIFHFENTPLVSIFAELERQFGVSIEYRGTSDRTATVFFSNENLQQALEVVCSPMGLTYEIKNNKEVIISEES